MYHDITNKASQSVKDALPSALVDTSPHVYSDVWTSSSAGKKSQDPFWYWSITSPDATALGFVSKAPPPNITTTPPLDIPLAVRLKSHIPACISEEAVAALSETEMDNIVSHLWNVNLFAQKRLVDNAQKRLEELGDGFLNNEDALCSELRSIGFQVKMLPDMPLSKWGAPVFADVEKITGLQPAQALDLLRSVLSSLNSIASAQPSAATAPPATTPGVGPISYAGAVTAAPHLLEVGTSAAAAAADEIQRLRQQLVGVTAHLNAAQNEAVRVRAELSEMEMLQDRVNMVVSGEQGVAALRSQSDRPVANLNSGTSAALTALGVTPALSGTVAPGAPLSGRQTPLSQVAPPANATLAAPVPMSRVKIPGPDKWTDQCLATSRVAEIFCEDLEVHCAYLRIDPADALPNFLTGKAREEMAGDDLRNESDMHRRKLLDPNALRMSTGSTLNAYITDSRNTLTVAGSTCMAPAMLVATFIRGLTSELQSSVVHDLALMREPTLNDAIQAAMNAQKAPPATAPVCPAPAAGGSTLPIPGYACHHCGNPNHFRDYCNLKHLPADEARRLQVQSLNCQVDLLVMPEMFSAFDVLMDSDWLQSNGALLDYLARTVTLQMSANKTVLKCEPTTSILAPHCAHILAKHSHATVSAKVAYKWLRKGGQSLVALISSQPVNPTPPPANLLSVHPTPSPANVLSNDPVPHSHPSTSPSDNPINYPTSIPPAVAAQLTTLISEFEDVFAPFNKLPPQRPVGHTIPLQPGCKPPALPSYKMSQPELLEMKKQVAAFLEQGIIEPSSSPYAAPVLFVKKKSGELRMCVDYRQLNKITLRDQYPLPRVDDLFDRIPDEDVPKTAFRTPTGLYQFKVLCFGLTNAPATFQRVMNNAFADVINDCALVYIDDILIMSKSVPDHFNHLRRVLELLRKHQFQAKLSKCEFLKIALKFLGHIVSDQGIAVDPDKHIVDLPIFMLRAAAAAREDTSMLLVPDANATLSLQTRATTHIVDARAPVQPPKEGGVSPPGEGGLPEADRGAGAGDNHSYNLDLAVEPAAGDGRAEGAPMVETAALPAGAERQARRQRRGTLSEGRGLHLSFATRIDSATLEEQAQGGGGHPSARLSDKSPQSAIHLIYISWLLLAGGDIEANPGPSHVEEQHPDSNPFPLFFEIQTNRNCQVHSLNNVAGKQWVRPDDLSNFWLSRRDELNDDGDKRAWTAARGDGGAFSDEVIYLYLQSQYGLTLMRIAQLHTANDWTNEKLDALAIEHATLNFLYLHTDLPTLLAAYGLLPILRSLNRLNLLCQGRAIFAEDLMQEVALTANKITALYSGPSPFSALDFPELTAFTNPHGSGNMTVQSDEADSDSEDEEEVGSRQAAADMETTFGENEEEEEGSELGSEPVQLYAIPPKGRRAALVPASDFQQHVDRAGSNSRCCGLAVVYAHYWDKQPSDEDFLERLAIVKARYCMDATLANGQLAPALLDQQKLSAQQSAFVEAMRCQAEHRVELSSAAANPAKETTKLWRYLAGQPITKADILEYFKLAELALVMTPGLVEEERMFSAMAYLKDDTRNRLQECHLNVCARVFSSNQFDLDTFPDQRAISKWLDNAAVRGRYRL
ncbi:hypothetical protein QJQ45_009341 [Haematococcus lacustris]|nr:hypothetical protein QJQ45_009341 [Haematococcus lacustris]